MPFGRLHEEAAGDGKLLALSDSAFRMWAYGLIYCQRNLTDGLIPEHAITVFGVHQGNLRRVADELCRPQLPGRSPLWERVADGFQVHDYFQWNDSRDEILRGRAKGKNRVRRYRERYAAMAPRDSEHPPLRHALQDALPNTDTNPLPHTLPVGVDRDSGGVPGKGVQGETPAALPDRPTATQLRRMPRLIEGAHPHHALCGRVCMHAQQFRAFVRKLGGEERVAEQRITAWFDEVNASLEGKPVPVADEFRFWNQHYDLTFGAPIASKPGPTSRTGAAPAGKYAGLTQGLS